MKSFKLSIGLLLVAIFNIPIGHANEPTIATDEEIRAAFAATHDGFSSDEILVQESLRNAFLNALDIDPENQSQFELQRETLSVLLRLRKTGRLHVATTRRGHSDHSGVSEAAEIAIRTVLDRHRASIDEVLCDPVLRQDLYSESQKITPGVNADSVGRTVLRLRKVRRLRPELVLRVAQWKRQVLTFSLNDVTDESVPHLPGVYLFRDQEGYLYIGEAMDLADRIQQHLDGSHNEGLAKILRDAVPGSITLELHAFASDSPAKQVTMRRAYESELIRSRQPRFNLRP